MTRRKLALHCVVSACLALLPMGCRRRTEAPQPKVPEAVTAAPQAEAPHAELTDETPVRQERSERGKQAPEPEEIPSGKAEVEDETVKARLARVFADAARERAAAVIPMLQRDVTVRYDEVRKQGFVPWSLPVSLADHVQPGRAKALEDMVKTLKDRAPRKEGFEPLEYCKAASGFLSHKDGAVRAIACEFLAHFPTEATKSGAIPLVAALLSDECVAFEGAEIDTGQRMGSAVAKLATVCVADVAQGALRAMTGCRFDKRSTFHAWWNANRNARQRLWYWSVRWRERKPEDDLDAIGELEPDTALKILLLASSHAALDAEAQFAWLHAAPRGRIDVDYAQSSRPASETIVRFVRQNSLEGLVRQLLSGERVWPEVRPGNEAARDLFKFLMPVCGHILTRADARFIEEILDEGQGPSAKDPGRQEELALLAAELDPDRAEATLASQLSREPRQPGVAVRLVNTTGLKHWTAVRRTFASKVRCRGKVAIVVAVAALRDGRRRALGELLAEGDVSARPTPNGSPPSGWHDRQRLFGAFVSAAQAANNDRPVVDEELLVKASFMSLFKVGREQEQPNRAHNRAVPVARQTALLKLKESFEQ